MYVASSVITRTTHLHQASIGEPESSYDFSYSRTRLQYHQNTDVTRTSNVVIEKGPSTTQSLSPEHSSTSSFNIGDKSEELPHHAEKQPALELLSFLKLRQPTSKLHVKSAIHIALTNHTEG
jgi:hypothetical protein